MKRKKRDGFTLIEMVIVIAIIGLISAVILVALGPSKSKAKDTRIVSDMQQILNYMETTFSPSTQQYNGTSTDATNSRLIQDIANQGGKNVALINTGATYAIQVTLNTKQNLCYDSNGGTGNSVDSKAGKCLKK